MACYALLQYCGIDEIFQRPEVFYTQVYTEHPRFVPQIMVGTFGNVSETASYLAVLTPLYLLFKEKRFLVFLAVLLLVIGLSGRLYAIAATAIGLAVYGGCRLWHAFPQRRWTLGLAAMSLVTVGWAGNLPDRLTQDERWPMWGHVFSEWQEKPYLGAGVGAFKINYYEKWETIQEQLPVAIRDEGAGWKWLHNEWLQWIYEWGLFTTIPLLLMFCSALRSALRKSESILVAGWIGVGIGLLVISTMHIAWHWSHLAALGCVAWAVWETQEVVI